MEAKFLKDFKGLTVEANEGEVKELTETQFAALSFHGIVEIYKPEMKVPKDKPKMKTK